MNQTNQSKAKVYHAFLALKHSGHYDKAAENVTDHNHRVD